MTEKELYKKCILDGIDLDYNKLSLCTLYNARFKPRLFKYQVHSDNFHLKFSEMFISLEDALDKFIELKEFLQRKSNDRASNL